MARRLDRESIHEWHINHRMTRRRAFLHLMSLLWIVMGVATATRQFEVFSRYGPSPMDWADSHLWAVMWIACGVASFVVSLARGVRDTLGFVTLVIPAIVWTTFGAYSFLVYLATQGLYGQRDAWQIMSSWVIIVGIIRITAAWEDPRVPLPRLGLAEVDFRGGSRPDVEDTTARERGEQ
jgi:hypothetical protein